MTHETLPQPSSITPIPGREKVENKQTGFVVVVVLRQVLTGMNSESSFLRLLSAWIADGYSFQCNGVATDTQHPHEGYRLMDLW